MAAPKSLLFQLHRHWELIEHLTRHSREQPSFEEAQVMALIARYSPEMSEQEHASQLRSLCNADVLQWLSRSNSLQINPLVLEFARGLTREHELGLSSVLRARVEAIRSSTDALQQGLQEQDTDRLRRAATQLSELFRQINQQLDQDRHAIMELAEHSKGRDAAVPLAKRYSAVLEAYDQYIEPMNEMMDSGLGGTFYPHLEAAEKALDQATEQLSVLGALYTHRLQLRLVAYQAKELRRMGRLVAQQCVETLLPLREEARQHSQLTTAISSLLGRVRKQGLRHALSAPAIESELPVWQGSRQRRVTVGDEVKSLMANALNFEPLHQYFPEESASGPVPIFEWVDERALINALDHALPIGNLMLWLKQVYPQLPDSVVLRLYHELVRNPRWSAHLQNELTSTALKTVRVRYHAHSLHHGKESDGQPAS
ncbi:MAG: hypothetical protein Q7L07_14325 [Pseudohongiella sp.]|nr:hypothetical protein [Pseudohongiella sp.]